MVSSICTVALLIIPSRHVINDNTALWGLDSEGRFLSPDEKKSFFKRIWNGTKKSSSANVDVRGIIRSELSKVHLKVERERGLFESKQISEKKKVARLLHLFQCDLLPGISGQILSSKVAYDSGTSPHAVSRTVKGLCYALIALINACMVFYIFLFAMQQTKYRQSAWLQSFLLWMLTETVFVSSIVVLVMHNLLPAMIMKDIRRLKDRMCDLIGDYRKNISSQEGEEGEGEEERENHACAPPSFNAAHYLFVSSKLARLLPGNHVARMIERFHTPWPRQSYQHTANTSNAYSTGMLTGLGSFAGIMLLFLLGGFVNLPQGMRDGLVHTAATVSVGYAVLLHTQLFQLFPALAFLPLFLVGVVVHFGLLSSRASAAARAKTGRDARHRQVVPHTDPGRGQGEEEEVEMSPAIPGEGLRTGVYYDRKASIVRGAQIIRAVQSLVDERSEVPSSSSGSSLYRSLAISVDSDYSIFSDIFSDSNSIDGAHLAVDKVIGKEEKEDGDESCDDSASEVDE
jgi:hypothetical protein